MESAKTSLISQLFSNLTPFLNWTGELTKGDTLKADAVAGITVALVLVPQSMAYAQLAGLPAYVGLYASFLPVIIAALFGSSRQLATGPVAIVSLMTATALEPLALTPDGYLAYAAIIAMMVGFLQLSLGMFRLGVLVDFMSHPVVLGFTNAAALIIASSQINKILGVASRKGEHNYETLWHLIQDIPHTHFVTLAMGVFSIFLLVFIKKVAPKLPNILITVVVCTLIAYFFGYESNGGAVVGSVTGGLPGFKIPDVEFAEVKHLMMPAAVIALLGFVEAISIAKALSQETRQRLSANQELIGQGLGNIIASLFQGYAVSGSFSRSAVNFSANAKTGFSSIITGLLVAITLLFLTPLLHHLPQATLAAVIMVAVIGLIKIQPIEHTWTVHPHDGFVAIMVFLSTLFFAPHLEDGIMIGVLLSLGLYIYQTMTPKLLEVSLHNDGTLRGARTFKLQTSDTIAIYRYDGDLYFVSAGYLERQLLNYIAAKPKLKVLILDLESVSFIDATGEEVISLLAEHLKVARIDFYIARAKKPLMDVFERTGITNKVGKHHFFVSRKNAALYARQKFGDTIDIKPLIKNMPMQDKDATHADRDTDNDIKN
jgi:SulP family sulfate permease